MRTTVLGASRFAVATIRHLIESGHEVVLIEQSRERIDELAETLDCGMINGDGTLPHTLQEAFGDGSEVFIALTNTDNVNILAAAVARSIGYSRVITQLTRTELLPIIEQLGLGETITPHETVARTLVEAIEQRDQVSTVGVLTNELRLMLLKVPDHLGDRTFDEIGLPDGARGIARIRGEEEVPLEAGTDVLADDRLLVLVSAADHDALLETFSEDGDAPS